MKVGLKQHAFALLVACLFVFPMALILIASDDTPLSIPYTPRSPNYPVGIESTNTYNYQAITGTIPSPDSLTDIGVRIENVATDWGIVGFDKDDYAGKTFSQLYWGAIGIPCHTRYYDLSMDYWYYNDTSQGGRKFSADWGNFNLIRNDSYVLAIQYQSQIPDAYSGSDDTWNATVRFTVLKQEPYIKVDVWIRYLNASALIKKIDLKPCYHEGGTDYTAGTDGARKMSYRIANDESYAVGHIGSLPTTSGNVFSTFGKYTQNVTQNILTENWHTSSVIIIGQNLDDLEVKAERLGDAWFTDYGLTDYNLVFAYNSDRIDCIDYFSSDGYSYVPTSTTEYVVTGGSLTGYTFKYNPLLNYAKIPIITNVDDHWQPPGADASWTWYYAQIEEYGVATTLPTQWGDVNSVGMSYFLNLSELRNRTLFEFGDHAWNHTSLYEYQDYEYQYDIWEKSETRWEDNTTLELLSEALPGNAWSYVTFDALGDAGCKNIRGSILANEFFAPYDFDYGAGTIFVTGFTDLYTDGAPSIASYYKGNAYGYLFMQGHIADFDTAGEKLEVLAWWDYLDANKDIFQTVTHAQFSDLWHNRISCYDAAGRYTIDLTDATVNHRLQVGPTGGKTSLLWDVTDNTPVIVESVTVEETIFYAEKGHIYQARADVSVIGSADWSLVLKSWGQSNGSVVARWNATPSTPTDAMSYTMYPPTTTLSYQVYQDDTLIGYGYGTSFNFVAIGSGEFELRIWSTKTVSSLVVLAVNMVGLGIVVSVVAGFVIPFAKDIQTGRQIKVDKAMKSLFKTVIFIVVGLLMWGLLHQIAIG